MPPSWVPIVVSAAALAVSTVAASFTGLTYVRSQESVTVEVHRDLRAALVPTTPDMYFRDYEAPVALRTRWLVRLSNTSNSTTVSVINVQRITGQFLGYESQPSLIIERDSSTSTVFADADTHRPILLPLRIPPGETFLMECFSGINIEKAGAANYEKGLPASPDGSLLMFGMSQRDMFGNQGEASPDGSWASETPSVVKQPFVRVQVSSTRGYIYSGQGNWYQTLYKYKAGSG